jgi:hypothetical protein
MVSVAMVVETFGVALLWTFGTSYIVAVAAVGLASAWTFQPAAISSARGYGLVLEIIAVEQATAAAPPSSTASAPAP